MKRVQCVKNKVGAPFKETNIVMRYGGGIDMIIPMVELAIRRKKIGRSGAYWVIPRGLKGVVGYNLIE